MRYIFCVGLKTCEVFETSQVFPRVCRTCHCERSVAIANYTLHADIAADKVRDCFTRTSFAMTWWYTLPMGFTENPSPSPTPYLTHSHHSHLR